MSLLTSVRVLSTVPRAVHQNAVRSFASHAQNGESATSKKVVLDLPTPEAEKAELNEIYQAPERVEPTHNIPVCNLQMRGYLPQQLDFYCDFARRAAFHLGMPCSGTIPLPTQTSRWTVIKSPFVHKKSQENFERKTHKRLLQIKDTHPEVVDRWLRYLTMNAPAGIGLRATKFEFEKLNTTKATVSKADQQ
ncbi:ribosomal protein S10 domain-containing protein [Radiomyces spectabilis]|uniref:ribosomal protein S10 domain-containing protein n=1 Tax=Radiomyces spectabilis TaxID=64574 RepID=UPI0022211547|nr:ribosomal protein S10 domain-containing protein [Radiomyces spectabilis]KAI8364694.1 ribosomal protein S10 domain-containing protein [Radiomyces spectabilis]